MYCTYFKSVVFQTFIIALFVDKEKVKLGNANIIEGHCLLEHADLVEHICNGYAHYWPIKTGEDGILFELTFTASRNDKWII